jgi:glutaredoxin
VARDGRVTGDRAPPPAFLLILEFSMAKDVLVFSQAGCVPCKGVKEYLTKQGVSFTVKDIGEDPAALRELVETYHSQQTPTVVIGGQVVIGFNRSRIDKLLAE